MIFKKNDMYKALQT